jgi:hypothetical protein
MNSPTKSRRAIGQDPSRSVNESGAPLTEIQIVLNQNPDDEWLR